MRHLTWLLSGALVALSACKGTEDTDGVDTDTDVIEADGDGDGVTVAEGDCDDTDETVFPGAAEVCDGADQNCDSSIDEGVTSTFYADGDEDGFGAGAAVEACAVSEGFALVDGDCDDAEAGVNPDAAEICDGIDQDCDGTPDQGLATVRYYADADADGYGDPDSPRDDCGEPVGFVTDSTDCDDADGEKHPDAVEVCDAVDQDCDGTADEDLPTTTFYADTDGDGFGDVNTSFTDCAAPEGYVEDSTDCDDGVGAINPDAAEVCDGIDQNCNVDIDDGLTFVAWYADVDLDGFGDDSTEVIACTAPSGFIDAGRDCDDGEASVNPAATEVCDGVDQDCDNDVDDGVLVTFYADVDQDGYGDAATTVDACAAPSGFVVDGTDCDDANQTISPAIPEVCDQVDQDCDGAVDEGVTSTFYADADADNYGDAAVSVEACSVPADFVADATDCDDGTHLVHPGATELCDGIDNACGVDWSLDDEAGIATFTPVGVDPINVSLSGRYSMPASGSLVICPGTYSAWLFGSGVDVDISSRDLDPTTTVIDATGQNMAVVVLALGDYSVRGLTLTHGTGVDLGGGITFGGGVYAGAATVYVADSILADNSARFGGAFYVHYDVGGATIESSGNTFVRNAATYDGGALYVASGSRIFGDGEFGDGADENSPFEVNATDLDGFVAFDCMFGSCTY